MALSSPIFNKIMSNYSPDVGSPQDMVNPIRKQKGSSLAIDPNDIPIDSISSMVKPSMGSGPIPGSTPNPTNGRVLNFMDKLWDVETKGGTMSDREGSQYKGIGQLGDAVRKPLLKKHRYTEEQYDNNINIQKEISTAHINDLKKRLGSDATELDLWGGHNMGVSGWQQIKSGKVSPSVLKNLRNQKGMNSNSTAEDYVAYYSKIFN